MHTGSTVAPVVRLSARVGGGAVVVVGVVEVAWGGVAGVSVAGRVVGGIGWGGRDSVGVPHVAAYRCILIYLQCMSCTCNSDRGSHTPPPTHVLLHVFSVLIRKNRCAYTAREMKIHWCISSCHCLEQYRYIPKGSGCIHIYEGHQVQALVLLLYLP